MKSFSVTSAAMLVWVLATRMRGQSSAPPDMLGMAARAKQHGAVTVSDGGIIPFQGGRAVLLRDPDVGGYVMLWQPGR